MEPEPTTQRTTGRVSPLPPPTLESLLLRVEALVGQMQGARGDVDSVRELAESILREIKGGDPRVIHIPTLPSLDSLTPVPSTESRPSKAVVAAKKGIDLGRYALLVTGGLTVVSQVVALWRPEYTGAVTAILRLVRLVFGLDIPTP